MVGKSLAIIKSFEDDIRKIDTKLPKSLNGSHGFISTKSRVSLELTEWSLKRLSDFLTTNSYSKANLLSMMTLCIEHFHSTTHVKQVLMSQLQYSRSFMTTIRESLKRKFPWAAYYFTNRKGSWYPIVEDSISFQEIIPLLPKKIQPNKIEKSKEENLQSWASTYGRAVRQRTVRQETTMCKTGTLPHYLYSSDAAMNEMANKSRPYEMGREEQVNMDEPEMNAIIQNEKERDDEYDSSSDEEIDGIVDDIDSLAVGDNANENVTTFDSQALF